MEPGHVIAAARLEDLSYLREIELAAAALLTGHAPDSVLKETVADGDLLRAQQEGRLWVALAQDPGSGGTLPVGFALVEQLAPDLPHLEELGVAPAHGRRGLGAGLVRAVCAWAARAGYQQLTLTTFRAVPFNMPFYARLGFEEIPASDLRPELQAVLRNEAARGLDPRKRVVMSYPLTRWPSSATAGSAR